MKEIITCEIFGTAMLEQHLHQTAGMTCPNCGWGWVTTLISEVDKDETLYTITIKKNATPTILEIKIISRICISNFLEAKTALKHDIILEPKSASETLETIRILEENQIKYSISPEFPHVNHPYKC